MREIVQTWFSLTRPVGPRFYAGSGFGLALLKYTLDATLVWLATGRLWTPLAYVNPSLAAREAATGVPSQWVFWVLVSCSLPFYWIGISMTVRRTVDAGLAAAWSLLFFVPIVNYLYMILLCFLPASQAPVPPPAGQRDVLGGVASSAASGVLVGLAMMAVSVVWLRGYGASLFLGAPFVMGFVSAFAFNRDAPRSVMATLGVAYLTLVVVAGLIALLALEGLVCLLMALPLALLLASLGAVLGRQIAFGGRPVAAVTSLLVSLPALTGFEARALRAPLREVATAVDIDAPPEVVWKNVIGIAELPPPGEWVFRLGIAYPVRARIRGAGVGAVRTCEFSTGPFVEPITEWDPPRRLAFDVRAQPPPMQEWSPYRHVGAPHLVDGLRSERGEFRLLRTRPGRTRLEGSTWYRNNLFPQLYWNVWSDALIHRIHRRVLEHVKRRSETAGVDS
ncbi:MAG: DUF805 domain-containing protein [Candidatus Binatia bacterium]